MLLATCVEITKQLGLMVLFSMLYHQAQDNEIIDNALFLHEYLNITFCLNPQIMFNYRIPEVTQLAIVFCPEQFDILVMFIIFYRWNLLKLSEGRDI